MKKIYLLFFAGIIALNVSAADKNVLITGKNDPAIDPIAQKFIDEIEAIDGIAVTHLIIGDYKALAPESFVDYDAVIILESPASADITNVGTNFDVPVINLKSYGNQKFAKPLYVTQPEVGWTTQKTYDISLGALTMIVENNDDILKDYSVGEEIVWSEGTENTLGIADAHCQTYDLSLSTVTDVQASATLLGSIKEVKDAGTVTPNFFWKIEENATTKRMVTWGIHHGFLGQATDDFWSIMKNSVYWVLNMTPVSVNSMASKFDLNISAVSASNITISLNMKENANVCTSIYDSMGKLVSTQSDICYNGSNSINVNHNLSKGLYIANIRINGNSISKKLLIK